MAAVYRGHQVIGSSGHLPSVIGHRAIYFPAVMTIVDAAAQIRAGRLKPTGLVEQCLAAIEKEQPRTNAFIRVDADRARELARRAERELADGQDRGALHGIPISLKDLIDV